MLNETQPARLLCDDARHAATARPAGVPAAHLAPDVAPEVWRRVLVPGSVRLDKLHRMIQAAMGWEDCHLHSFFIGDDRWGMQFDDMADYELDEKSVTVLSAIGDAEAFVYEYDFGDSWRHDVVVEARWRMPIGLKFGVCLAGENACPLEDVGGPPGYEMLLQVLADSSHEDYEHLRGWAGGPVDPREFDLGLANARLHAVR
jgi:hypothetical protein